MFKSLSVNRRGFLGLSVAAGSVGAIGAACSTSPTSDFFDRNRFVIRNSQILTMDPDLGDFADGDVHVQDGVIVAVGTGLDAGDADSLDGRGMIVLPGLVETHWHMWTGLFRSLPGGTPEQSYFPVARKLGQIYTPTDMYNSVMLSTAEAIDSGITYVHDWCHNIRSPEHATASLEALVRSGLRGRFSYGKPIWAPNDASIDLDDLERLHGEWSKYSGGGSLELGVAWTGRASFGVPRPVDVYRSEFDAITRLGLPITMHLFAGGIADLAQNDVLTKGMQVVHAVGASNAEKESMAAAGASLSLSPFTELRGGMGFPEIGEFVSRGIPVGLSVDTTASGGSVDMFAIMRMAQNVENALRRDEFALPARQALEMATIGGARAMGVDGAIGSLAPGKRADLIMLRTDLLNMTPVNDVARLVVGAAQPTNVDTVFIGGKPVKWKGILTDLNPVEIMQEASKSMERIRKEADI